MTTKSREFPDGFIKSLDRRSMSIAYPPSDPEVFTLVDRLLRASEAGFEGLIGAHTYLSDSPELAVRALALNIGRTLPKYDERYHVPGGSLTQIGETRVIEPADEFTIVGGPYTNYPSRSFLTVMTHESNVESLDPTIRTRLSCNDFSGIPISF